MMDPELKEKCKCIGSWFISIQSVRFLQFGIDNSKLKVFMKLDKQIFCQKEASSMCNGFCLLRTKQAQCYE